MSLNFEKDNLLKFEKLPIEIRFIIEGKEYNVSSSSSFCSNLQMLVDKNCWFDETFEGVSAKSLADNEHVANIVPVYPGLNITTLVQWLVRHFINLIRLKIAY